MNDKRHQIPELLQELNGLQKGNSKEVSLQTGIPEADIYGVGSFYHLLADPNTKIRVCTGLSCRMSGADEILETAKKMGLPTAECSCLAACDKPPAVLRDRATLPQVTVESIEETEGDWEKLMSDFAGDKKSWKGEVGPKIDDPEKLPLNLLGKQNFDGNGLKKTLSQTPEVTIKEIENSGLQGRGGAGFPAAFKWNAVLKQEEKTRYVVLNADEGEPGTFKDREIMLRRPDLVIECLAIAAKVIGAKEIYLYLRGEFEFPKVEMRKAIQGFKDNGLLEDLEFHFHDGQGAYICGEETALLEALEGKRGMPRLKPPFPVEKGLWQKPTLIHNVETIACIPSIVSRGGKWFKDLGITEPGIKLYCISGHVKNPGIYEMPLGITLDELVEEAGGYIGRLKAFSPGGASSGFLPASFRNVPLDFKGLQKTGSMLGSAGVVVLNDSINMKWAVAQQLEFFERESCGQCAPCRIGTRYLREALESKIDGTESSNKPSLEFTEDVSWQMTEGSICGLGQIASLPLTSAQKYFPKDFE